MKNNNNNKKNNPKLKTGETVSRFELHSPVKKTVQRWKFARESENQQGRSQFGSENWDFRAATSNKPSIQPAPQGQMQVDT